MIINGIIYILYPVDELALKRWVQLNPVIHIGYDPMNQTTSLGNFPIGSNPLKFLYYSFESKEPLAGSGLIPLGCKIKPPFSPLLLSLTCGSSGTHLSY